MKHRSSVSQQLPCENCGVAEHGCPVVTQDWAFAEVGATSEAIAGKAIIVASPTFRTTSRRVIPAKGET